jgi:hypothetical protein
MVAEVTAREIGRITLAEALELTILIARRDPRRHQRVAVHWLQRYIDEHPGGDARRRWPRRKLPDRANRPKPRGCGGDASGDVRQSYRAPSETSVLSTLDPTFRRMERPGHRALVGAVAELALGARSTEERDSRRLTGFRIVGPVCTPTEPEKPARAFALGAMNRRRRFMRRAL